MIDDVEAVLALWPVDGGDVHEGLEPARGIVTQVLHYRDDIPGIGADRQFAHCMGIGRDVEARHRPR